MPVSTNTIPPSVRSAQPLTCGTPGHGSGRRSRQTPGRTRSARPSSRSRRRLATAARILPAVERLSERVVLVRALNPGPMTLGGTNTYLVGAPAWVVDPGPPDHTHARAVLDAAESLGGVAGIVLTHRHFDHAGAVRLLLDEVDVEVLAGPQGPPEGRFGEPDAEDLPPTRIVRQGDHAGPFDVIETPGHAADHISLITRGELFSGDTVLGEGSVFIPPGGGSLGRYLESLRRLRTLDAWVLYPGHGPVVPDPAAKIDEYIAHRLDRERRLV